MEGQSNVMMGLDQFVWREREYDMCNHPNYAFYTGPIHVALGNVLDLLWFFLHEGHAQPMQLQAKLTSAP